MSLKLQNQTTGVKQHFLLEQLIVHNVTTITTRFLLFFKQINHTEY